MNEGSHLTPEEIRALTQAFYAQAKEMLQDYSERVLDLERLEERPEVIRALERIVHTIKGDSMALEFTELSKLSHRLEDYLRTLRSATALEREAVDLLLVCGDRMSQLLEAYCAEPRGELVEIESLVERLAVGDGRSETREISLGVPHYRASLWFAPECAMHSAGAFLVCQRLSELARVVAVEPDPDAPEIETTRKWSLTLESEAGPKAIRSAARVPGVTSRVTLSKLSPMRLAPPAEAVGAEGERRPPSTEEPGAAARSGGAPTSEQLRVEVGKIDRIMNLVGELVIGRSMVAQSLAELSRDSVEHAAAARLSDANAFLERSLKELQASVLKIRMVPVEHVFRRFPRLVRDLAHARGKEVRLSIEGGLTELDKSIVDALGEPLLHLVRNAVDHGLEAPAERERKGKPRAGTVRLAAFYEGNHAHVLVEDDGRGIDAAEVGLKAVKAGLVDAAKLDALTPSEVLNFIYQPGFSTRDTVSDISGRGIGMDVVRESVENLKGVIDVSTKQGRGTRFLIRLPLTLAILRAVLVEVAGRAFAVPLTGVLEILRLGVDESASVLGRGALHWRGRVVPLVPLDRALRLDGGDHSRGARFVLLVGEAERRVGLIADRLLGEQELVAKPIEDGLSRSSGISGASILGNGRLVLILHVRGLLDEHASSSHRVEVLA